VALDALRTSEKLQQILDELVQISSAIVECVVTEEDDHSYADGAVQSVLGVDHVGLKVRVLMWEMR
jgi:hypothetical protein